MGGVADDGLVKVPDLDFDAPILVGKRTEIAQMAVAAVQTGGPSGTSAGQVSSQR
jgi:hypothetical protein